MLWSDSCQLEPDLISPGDYICPEGWLTLATPALGMSAANHSYWRNVQGPLEVQQPEALLIWDTCHRVTYATPYVTAALLSKSSPQQVSTTISLSRDGRRWAEVSSVGCWYECFLPWLPNCMVNDDPQYDCTHRTAGTSGDHG